MFKKLASLIPLQRGSTCDACGSDFKCGVSLAGCWCTEIKLSDATRAEVRSRYRGCLCRQCLEQLSAREVAPATVDNPR